MSMSEERLSKENLELVAEVTLLRENNAAMDMLLYEALIGAEEVNKELKELRGQNRRLRKEVNTAERQRDEARRELLKYGYQIREGQHYMTNPLWTQKKEARQRGWTDLFVEMEGE